MCCIIKNLSGSRPQFLREIEPLNCWNFPSHRTVFVNPGRPQEQPEFMLVRTQDWPLDSFSKGPGQAGRANHMIRGSRL